MNRKNITLIMNGKGGVGKSFFTINYVQHLKDHQLAHVAIDTDNENSTLKRFHSEAEFINLKSNQQIDRLFTLLEANHQIIVDCRAASTDIFLDYFREVNVFEILNVMNASLTVVSPINHESDSIEQVRLIAEAFGNQCHYIIVKNHSHSDQFQIYDQSRLRQKLLNDFSAEEINMPYLYDWLVTKLNQANVTASQGILYPDFSLIDRQRLKNWTQQFEQQIESVSGKLLISHHHVIAQ